MTSLATLGAAGLLTAAALLGTTTGTLGDPAIACAEPKGGGLDRLGYEACADEAHKKRARGEITSEEWNEALFACCYENGGEWHMEDEGLGEGCFDPPAKDNEYPAPPLGQLPQIPGPTEATQAPPPAPPGNTAAQLPSLPPVQTR